MRARGGEKAARGMVALGRGALAALALALSWGGAQAAHFDRDDVAVPELERTLLTGKAALADGSEQRPWQVGMMTYAPFVEDELPARGYVIDYLAVVKKLIESKAGVPFNMEYTLQPNVTGGNGALSSMAGGAFNFVISGITITPVRERELADFGEAHFPAGTGMLTKRPKEVPYFEQILSTFTSESAARNLAMLAFLSLLFANFVYFAERGQNEEFLASDYAGGLSRAVWFSFVTVTTTGFGDIVPLTRRGRIVATVWMGVGVIIMSIFSADVLSRLTAHRVQDGITGPDDLRGRTCAVSRGTPWVEMCGAWGATVRQVASSAVGRDLVQKGVVDVTLGDWPVMELWLLESAENRRNFHMAWRSTTDGPFGPGFPHLAQPRKNADGKVNQTELAAFQRHYRMRELLNMGILFMKGSTDEETLLARYFGGLSLTSLSGGGDGKNSLDIVPARMNDPFIILGLLSVLLYLVIIVVHESGYRIRTDTFNFIQKRQELNQGDEDDEDSLNAADGERPIGLARAAEMMRLERRVDRMWRLLENLDSRMVESGLVPERVVAGEAKVKKVYHAEQFVRRAGENVVRPQPRGLSTSRTKLAVAPAPESDGASNGAGRSPVVAFASSFLGRSSPPPNAV